METLNEKAVKAKFKETIIIKGAQHHDSWQVGDKHYFNNIKQFLKKLEIS
jgi:hypothetical protein